MGESSGQSRLDDPIRKFQFRVSVIGGAFTPWNGNIGFSEVAGLRSETESVTYKEGDRTYERKIPGRTTFPNIVLSRGVDQKNALVRWRQRVIEGGGMADHLLRAALQIDVYDRRGPMGNATPVRTWFVHEAWPVSLEVDDLSGTASDALIERLELAHEELVLAVNNVRQTGTSADIDNAQR